MRYITLSILILLSNVAWAQFVVEGVVLSSEDTLGLPGVLVYTDSLNGVFTDESGRFKITVENETDSLTFAFIGMVTRVVPVNYQSNIEVFLKPFLHIDYFDSQNIGLYFSSGVVNSPIGGEIFLSSPYLFDQIVVKGLFGYQTNLKDNFSLDAQVDIDFIIRISYFSMSLKADYREVELGNKIEFISRAIESEFQIPYVPFNLILGYSDITYSDNESNNFSETGPLFGLDYYLRPVHLSMLYKMMFYNSTIDYKAEISRSFRIIDTFVRYHKLKSYSELTLGIGIRFIYRFSNPNKY